MHPLVVGDDLGFVVAETEDGTDLRGVTEQPDEGRFIGGRAATEAEVAQKGISVGATGCDLPDAARS
jgi:hypothetical protein